MSGAVAELVLVVCLEEPAPSRVLLAAATLHACVEAGMSWRWGSARPQATGLFLRSVSIQSDTSTPVFRANADDETGPAVQRRWHSPPKIVQKTCRHLSATKVCTAALGSRTHSTLGRL